MVSSRFFLSLAACAVLGLANAIPEPVITPAPIAGRQAFEQALIGYYSFADNVYESAECPFGSTWTASSTYGRCCATSTICTAGDYITRCSGNGVVYGDGLSAPCSGTFSLCNTDQIIKTVDDANPTFWIGCDDDGLQTFYYRTMPGAANVISTPSSPTTTTPPSPNVPSTTTPGTTTAPGVVVITPDPTSDPKPGKSKAFIAGVVVGPVALVAIIGLIVWIICIKRSKKRNRDPHEVAQQYEAQQQMAAAPQQYQQPQSPPPQDPRYSAAPTYSNVSYQGSYQQPSVYSPGVSTMSSPQMPYSEGAVGHQNPAAGGGYFSPDSKTPAVTTSQQGAGAPNQAYSHPTQSELQ
ncbi:hypothetical protein BKA61DRAFT_668151 [Leptodontidium sp. MPI-SDFR-AT-0119]|nr:hypothetical protein BKA61DRAFT_668151 [Leptodontidium sp. MPI-SDFR-AT-0119]